METTELELEGKKYSIGKIDTFKQYHLVRRLLPALMALGESGVRIERSSTGGIAGLSDLASLVALAPMAEVIAKMSDEESEYVINTCLLVCKREMEPGSGKWAPVKVRGSAKLQFDDIELPEMMQLVFAVIQENLGRFFPVPAAPKG